MIYTPKQAIAVAHKGKATKLDIPATAVGVTVQVLGEWPNGDVLYRACWLEEVKP